MTTLNMILHTSSRNILKILHYLSIILQYLLLSIILTSEVLDLTPAGTSTAEHIRPSVAVVAVAEVDREEVCDPRVLPADSTLVTAPIQGWMKVWGCDHRDHLDRPRHLGLLTYRDSVVIHCYFLLEDKGNLICDTRKRIK